MDVTQTSFSPVSKTPINLSSDSQLLSPGISNEVNGSKCTGPLCASTPKGREPQNEVDVREDLMPRSPKDIDKEAWVNLPPDVQWEVKQMMKKRSTAVAMELVQDGGSQLPYGDAAVGSKPKKRTKRKRNTEASASFQPVTLEKFFIRFR
ncbi:unnamed protein product [Soboliphyme baturini]|uniref:Uncharacterized protein n=1 Tax=Soboliphyme baturini TaxID=241478 RepID=A0A183J8B7_9BILA|nr:unnamed protein product [Soboliphyme baturini]